MGRFSTLPIIVAALTAASAASGALAQTGGNNGAKVGKWGFLLNVSAFERCPAGDFLDSNRHQIAVQANYTGNATDKSAKVNKIFLKSSGVGGDFWVQDGNACDQTGAYFYLPITAANCSNCTDPTLPEPTFTEYEVRARVLGKPGGKVTVTSCVEMLILDPITGEETLESFCSVGDGDNDNIWVGTRTVGSGKEQNKWYNVSADLLTVCVDTIDDAESKCDTRLGLFDSRGEEYWWNWDTQGRPHVQLVFFPVESGAR